MFCVYGEGSEETFILLPNQVISTNPQLRSLQSPTRIPSSCTVLFTQLPLYATIHRLYFVPIEEDVLVVVYLSSTDGYDLQKSVR